MTKNDIEEKMLSDIVNELITKRIRTEKEMDSEYVGFIKEQEKIEAVYRGLELSGKEKEIMDKYMEAMFESDVAYGYCAYKTGFWDCLVILKQLGIIGE